ncbi:TetR/AcrR family transcriptional regulator [Ruania rhizosphaerae]|uniref:TetR/AcrR family transcriptional regulator n=1 Tax=Ruania rhizosphaerae TaxID=1840413 RepID=UPI00135890AA|nr:TetR/AcrR family transcriptional regulator [Ruania rhizosphaerae]
MNQTRNPLPTKHRLVTVAIDAFGREGFDVGIRTITSRATAAAGIVQYHFGGKEGLREACDRRVLAIVDRVLPIFFPAEGVVRPQLADDDDFESVLYYCMRSLGEGAPLARPLVSRLTSHVYGLLGSNRGESPDELRERARRIVRFGLGATMLDFAVGRPDGLDPAVAFVMTAWETEFLPLIARIEENPDMLVETNAD